MCLTSVFKVRVEFVGYSGMWSEEDCRSALKIGLALLFASKMDTLNTLNWVDN